MVFWLALFLLSDFVLRLPLREHRHFLDKMCIHQRGANLSERGHRTLGHVPSLWWTVGGLASRRELGAAVDGLRARDLLGVTLSEIPWWVPQLL